jgi:uncharacterized protein
MESNLNETRCSVPNLQGQTGWIITDDKAGNLTQAQGVAEALGLNFLHKQVSPRGLRKLLSPWAGVGWHERFGQPGSMFAPPWPAVAIATGRASIPYLISIRRAAGAGCFTVVLQDPRTGPKTADLIWVPEHDRMRGPNVISTITSPHRFSPERLAEFRAALPRGIAELPSPRVAVVVGGPNSAYSYPLSDLDRLTTALESLVALGASFMITPSRRTRRDMIEAIDKATVGAPRILWRGEGDNPYPYFLASADCFIVTADSVNMMGEACATGRPVYLFMPTGEPGKFGKFHAALEAHGATRDLPERFACIEEWAYPPLYSATRIAEEIERRWQRRSTMLSGLMQR